MKITILHASDALEPPVDPVLGQIRSALVNGGHETSMIAVDKDLAHTVRDLTDDRPDLVFNVAESYSGKSALEGSVAGLLNLLDLRYTGSSPAGLMLAGDKSIATKMLRAHGVKTPESTTLYRGAGQAAGKLSFPVIVKPPQEDASLGITGKSVVKDLQELFQQMDVLNAEYTSPILVEEFIDGREFYVGVLGNSHPQALPVVEMDFTGFPADQPRIASWAAKWGDDGEGSGAEYAGTKSIFPENLDEDLVERMNAVALDAYRALRLRDYARVDMRVTPAGEVYVLEINPNCYLEKEAEFARAAQKAGMEYDALIARIVELASARYAR
ncbi:MAG TPA: ATP-grasp domain-containing protein [Gemmatimonadaceae bacterium]|nr:ATP-grasp domain-containing protein [Gemmatimonadaceae bacterium]